MNIVKELIKKAGIQQKTLAVALGVSRPTVSDWAANKKDPRGENLKKLAKYFGVDELVVLGIGVSGTKEDKDKPPRTVETRIVSAGMDDLPKEYRERILAVFLESYEKAKLNKLEKGDADET